MNSRLFRAALVAGAVLLAAATPVLACPVTLDMDDGMPADKPTGSVAPNFPEDSLKDEPTPEKDSRFETFKQAVTNGRAGKITGLFVPGFKGLYVVQQGKGDNTGVSPVDGVVTQFSLPSGGVVGLMAHNYAAGKWFESFTPNSLVYVIYGDGKSVAYRITDTLRFKAKNGKSPSSDLIDLSTGETRTADQVYNQVYTGRPHLTLQTCIEEEGNWKWGRLFLLAEPVL